LESRASYEVKGVVNISFPVLIAQGSAVAGLTVPYVSESGTRPAFLTSWRCCGASQQISEALGAAPKPEKPKRQAKGKT
jgi:hypothetical protein